MKTFIVILFLSVLTLPTRVLAHAGDDYYDHHDNMMGWWGMNGGMGYWFGILASLTWIVWLIVGVLAVVWLWKQIKK